jgi:hypothetical protein
MSDMIVAELLRHFQSAALAVVLASPTEALRLVLLASLTCKGRRA